MAFRIKSSEEKRKEELERDQRFMQRIREDNKIRLINPFEPEKFKVRGDSFLYDPTDFPRSSYAQRTGCYGHTGRQTNL